MTGYLRRAFAAVAVTFVALTGHGAEAQTSLKVPPLTTTTTPATPRAGDQMPDGTVYVGISGVTREHICAMPTDAPQLMAFGYVHQASPGQFFKTDPARSHSTYLATLAKEPDGRNFWRLPYVIEAFRMWQNRNVGKFKDTFNDTVKNGEDHPFYLTHEQSRVDGNISPHIQGSKDLPSQYALDFSDGKYYNLTTNSGFRVRAVRRCKDLESNR